MTEPPQGDPAGPPAPPPPTEPRKDVAPLFMLVTLVIVLVIALAAAGFLGLRALRDRDGGATPEVVAPSPSAPGPSGSASSTPPGDEHELTGTFSYPGPCEHDLAMRVLDAEERWIAETPMTQEERDGACEAPFSATLPPSDRYSLALVMSDPSTKGSAEIAGPSYTAAELAEAGYELTLTLDDFGMDAARAEVEADLSLAIDAAERFFKRHDTFEGLTVAALRKLEPSLRFDTSAVAGEDVVSLRLADERMVLFAEMTVDGTPIVMGFHPPSIVCYGEIDTDSFKKCLAWQPWDADADGKPDPGSSPAPM